MIYKPYKPYKEMGFFSNAMSGVIKVAITPIAIVKDVANVVTGEEPKATKDLLESAGKDLDKAVDNLCGED